jgi:hypothetical protein
MAKGINNKQATTTLNGAINDTVTTVNTNDDATTAGFPTAPFTIEVNTEVMYVSSTGTGQNWTVVRGYDGTAAASHANGDSVAFVVVAQDYALRWDESTTDYKAVDDVDLNGKVLYGPLDPTAGTQVGDRDFNDARYVYLQTNGPVRADGDIIEYRDAETYLHNRSSWVASSAKGSILGNVEANVIDESSTTYFRSDSQPNTTDPTWEVDCQVPLTATHVIVATGNAFNSSFDDSWLQVSDDGVVWTNLLQMPNDWDFANWPDERTFSLGGEVTSRYWQFTKAAPTTGTWGLENFELRWDRPDGYRYTSPVAASPTTTQGDIIVRGASADERLPVGSNDQVLTVVSGQPTWVL